MQEGRFQIPGPVHLHHGGQLARLDIGWSLRGNRADPVVLVLGGISASRTIFDPDDDSKGWWRDIAGPGKALDTRGLAILGMDYIGGSGESTGPVAGMPFPSLSSHDQAAAVLHLLDHLGIERLDAIIGASYGGMVALAFGERHPRRAGRLVVISAADMPHPMATAWRSVERDIVRLGLDTSRRAQALELSRALAMSTYRSPAEFAQRFRGPPRLEDGRFVFPVEQYLHARGRDYAASYLPESFICLSESIDLHHVDATTIRVPTEAIAVEEDQLVPLDDMRAMAARLPQARLHTISSLRGHDAFLKEADQLRAIFTAIFPGESP